MKTRHILLASVAALTLAACSTDYLKPKPLSIYTPETTYTSYNAIRSAVLACNSNMNSVFGTYTTLLGWEMTHSDVAINGTTDNGTTHRDLDAQLTPSVMENSFYSNAYGGYWTNNYNGIKYANIILNRMQNVENWKDEAQENEIRGWGLFYRAYHYYKLVCQWGDVPWIGSEIESPRTDFNSYDRWSILETIEKDAAYAYKWIGEQQDMGFPNKGAAGVIYMKILMLNGKFDQAIEVGKQVVAAHPLMSKDVHPNYANAQLYLFSPEGKVAANQSEGLFTIANWPDVTGNFKTLRNRNFVPYWAQLRTPEGKSGCNNGGDPELYDTIYDNNKLVGRGINTHRATDYYTREIWTDKELNDERGIYNRDSWRSPTDLYYNIKAAGEYYKQHIADSSKITFADQGARLRHWADWPHFKTYAPDDKPNSRADIQGGPIPLFILRSAEAYLLMAECYYWKGESFNQQQVDMLNVVRARGGADPLTAADAGIAAILAERARELYLEEERHIELVRISYIYAKTGKTCEEFGTTYSMSNFYGPDQVMANCKENGHNFWFDWVDKHNNFVNNGIFYGPRMYTMSVHHVLFPVPESAITSNTQGVINQNPGYAKIQDNITPLKVGDTEGDLDFVF